MDSQAYIENVATLELNVDLCIGCGMCEQVCPHAVFVVEDRKSQIVNRDACMECGACQRNCPTKAIKVDVGVGCASAMLGDQTCDDGSCCGSNCC